MDNKQVDQIVNSLEQLSDLLRQRRDNEERKRGKSKHLSSLNRHCMTLSISLEYLYNGGEHAALIDADGKNLSSNPAILLGWLFQRRDFTCSSVLACFPTNNKPQRLQVARLIRSLCDLCIEFLNDRS